MGVYIVESVETIEEYKYYGSDMVRYKLVLSGGEVCYYNRAKHSAPPAVGDEITGTIGVDKMDEPLLKITRKKPAKLVEPSDMSIDVRGSYLFEKFLESTGADMRTSICSTPLRFVGTFKLFQRLLFNNGIPADQLELLKAQITKDIADINNVVE